MPHRLFVKSALAICLTLASTVAVTLPARTVDAKPPAAKGAKQPLGVGAITGPQGSKVRAKVIKVLRDSGSYEVTDVEDIKPGSPAQKYQTMATGIQADAIVVGTVSKNMTLTLSIYAANGARIDAVTIKGGGSAPKLLKEIENELEIAVADPLSRARPTGAKPAAAAAPAAAAPAPAPAKAAAAEDTEDEDEPAKPAAKTEPAAKAKPSEDEESVEVATTPEDAPAEQSASSSDASPASSDEGEKGRRPVELLLGIRGYNRKFNYTGMQAGPLTPYELALAPTVFLAGRVYPFAFKSNGVLSHLGVMGRYELGLATKTNYQPVANGPITTLQTRVYAYELGIRGRLPLGPHELGMFAEYGNQSFALIGDENPKGNVYALVPDVHYHFIRTGLDVRFYISKLVLEGHVAPRFLTSKKELDLGGVWFAGAVGSGLDAGLMLGWAVTPWLTAAGGADFVRYGFDFNNLPPEPPPRVIAGGATDTYLSAWLGVSTNFEFSAKAEGGSASVSAAPAEASEESDKSPEPAAEEPQAEAPKAKQPKAKEPEATPPKSKKAAPAKKPAKKKGAPAPAEEEEEEEE